MTLILRPAQFGFLSFSALLGLLSASPTRAQVAPQSAEARDTVPTDLEAEYPYLRRGVSAWKIVSFPFQLVTLPLDLAGTLAGWGFDVVEDTKLPRKAQQLLETLGRQGVRPGFARLGPNSGLGAGLAYAPPFARFRLAVSGSYTVRGYQGHYAKIGGPLSDGIATEAEVRFWRQTRHEFYGIGHRSARSDSSDARLDRLSAGLAVSGRAPGRLAARLSGGWVQDDVGPGWDDAFPDAQTVHSPEEVPALEGRFHYWRVGLEAGLGAAEPASRRARAWVHAGYAYWDGARGTPYHFHRFRGELGTVLPLGTRQRRVLLRAVGAAADPAAGAEVPFYMLPALGGSRDLRGFRNGRFRDRVALLGTVEYQYRVWELGKIAADAAIFGDVGGVYRSVGREFRLGDLHGDYGFGFRIVAGGFTAARLDVAFSHEDTRVHLAFSPVTARGVR